jgi:hypothetical protein
MATTYTKLRDGSWGVRIEGPAPAAGQTVVVTKKSGESKAEKIGKVLWTSPGSGLLLYRRLLPQRLPLREPLQLPGRQHLRLLAGPSERREVRDQGSNLLQGSNF